MLNSTSYTTVGHHAGFSQNNIEHTHL